MQLEPLIERTRGGLTECLHYGAVAVVDAKGTLLAHAGDPHWRTFTRSTLKALQALPLLEAGGATRFGFTSADLAMLCASHSGEDRHVTQVQGMLDKAGQTYKVLRCGCHVPMHFDVLQQTPPAGAVFDERHNNCSGKHAGFVAYCVQQGLGLENYEDRGHPLQQAIARDVARAVRLDVKDLAVGTDGCSAPNYAMPLSNLATGYARLASGETDSEFGASFALLAQAMTQHPGLVSGEGRNDLDFMSAGAGDWVTKVGADGVQVVASRSRAQAVALKIADGDKPALFAATVEVLSQLGWLNEAQSAALQRWRARPILNVRGLLVGERLPTFQLQFA